MDEPIPRAGSSASQPLPSGWFDRIDEAADDEFYVAPRFVQHIDEGAIAAVTGAIGRHVPPGSRVLDLMSSWVSHLPPADELPLARVVGLGLNAEELAANPRLDEWIVQDVNANPRLPFPDDAFDAVLITVSVQYLTRPIGVFRELARVTRQDGVILVSFSNRMFATKAVRIWQETPEAGRAGLVAHYLALAGGWDEPAVETHRPRRGWSGGDPLWVVIARRAPRTPLSRNRERGVGG